VLAEVATVRIQTGEAGTYVVLMPACSELDPTLLRGSPDHLARLAMADIEGVAVIEGVPAEVELEVYPGDLTERWLRRRGALLVSGLVVSTEDTRPIVALPRETLELELPTRTGPPGAPRLATGVTEAIFIRDETIRAELAQVRTAKLTGTLRAAVDFEPCVALQDKNGRALWLHAPGQTFNMVAETGRRGRYFVRDVPAGPVTLLVGTRAELERGEPRWTEPFDFGVDGFFVPGTGK